MTTVITLIGSGNVSWHLGSALTEAGHNIETVYSRNLSNAKTLADLFPGCTFTDQLDFSKNSSELFILAISDSALKEVISKIQIPTNAIIIHTSGTMPMEVLNKFSHYGVLYPIQTFTKGKEIKIAEVPFGLEASDDVTYQKIYEIAFSLSKKGQPISSEQRKVIHIAAVFACNFSNHLFSISESILKKEGLNFSILESLIQETVAKALEISPLKAQTGPAIRGDEETIAKHLNYLKSDSELQELYRIFSERIKKQN
jgi:predicted short-subunit dehydrogenase-like oxidoreductase (DUF2520 family)